MKEQMQPSIDFVINILSKRKKSEREKNVLYFIIKAIVFFCLITFMWYSIKVVKISTIYSSPTLRLPGQYLFSCPLIGIVLMIFQFLTEVLGVLLGDEKPFASKTEEVDLV
jgi:TRAP-type C4-dicarboxylate transport system permease small subunit